MAHERRTRIVATVGPASRDPGMLAALVEAGVNVFRLNLSHGTHEQHLEVIERIRGLGASIKRCQPMCGTPSPRRFARGAQSPLV